LQGKAGGDGVDGIKSNKFVQEGHRRKTPGREGQMNQY
jgi:hypothetical protein